MWADKKSASVRRPRFNRFIHWLVKAGTHEGACSRSTLLQHSPGAKFPRLHPRFLAKTYVAQQKFCSLVSNWFDEGASSRGKTVARFCFRSKPSCVLKFALRERVSGASSPVCTEICFAGACFRSKLPRMYWLGYLPGSVFQEQAPSCVLVGVLTRERVSGACFRSKPPRVYRPLRSVGTQRSRGRGICSLSSSPPRGI